MKQALVEATWVDSGTCLFVLKHRRRYIVVLLLHSADACANDQLDPHLALSQRALFYRGWVQHLVDLLLNRKEVPHRRSETSVSKAFEGQVPKNTIPLPDVWGALRRKPRTRSKMAWADETTCFL